MFWMNNKAIIKFGFRRIWRILQIKEGVIHRGWRPRWITPSEILRILYILQKPNSIIALLLIQNISSFLKEFRHYALCMIAFPLTKYNTTLCPGFSVNGSIICGGQHFWRHFDNIGSIIFGGLHFWCHWFNMGKILSKFGEQQLVMVNYTCDLTNQKRGNILNE